MRKGKRLAAWLLAALLVLSLSGCRGETEQTVSAALTGQITTLDPAMVTTDGERMVAAHLYENLLKLKSDGEGGVTAAPGMAESWRCEEQLDGTEVYTFSLRRDVTWSDGQRLTASDFVYAWQRLADPATGSPNAALLDMVAGYDQARGGDPAALAVSAPAEDTLQVVLAHRCTYFLSSVCTDPAAAPVRADPAPETMWPAGQAQVVGNGPYAVTEYGAEALTAEAREGYYDRKTLGPDVLRFCPADTAELAARRYQEEDLDFLPGEPGVVLGGGDEADVSPVVGVLLVNQMAQVTEDETLRRALSLAVDRTSLAAGLGGGCLPAEGLVPYGVRSTQGEDFRTLRGSVIDNESEDLQANRDAARTMLREAGYDDAALAALGQVPLLHSDTPLQKAAAHALQDTWQQELGLSVKLVEVTAEELDTALARGEFTMALTTVRGDRNDPIAYLGTWRSGGEGNWANFHANAYDLLLNLSDDSSSAEARDAYLGDAEQLLLDKGNVTPLIFTTRSYRLRQGLTGLFSDGMGVYYLTGLHTASNG
jgi:oligopeptide transport system substrate-binding protein